MPAPSVQKRDLQGQISRQAPYLRRYARALTGVQTQGDGLVRRAIERIEQSVASDLDGASLRLNFFKILHRVWREHRQADADADATAQEARAALLLSAIEGFCLIETAGVLNISQEQLAEQLALARRILLQQPATRVLIIEDEPIIALDLTRLMREMGHHVVGAAATRAEAVRLAAESAPGLILADIRLADGTSGMDAAADIVGDRSLPVVFITAFPEHLLTGERPEPAFLITKPFREDAVKALAGHALHFQSRT